MFRQRSSFGGVLALAAILLLVAAGTGPAQRPGAPGGLSGHEPYAPFQNYYYYSNPYYPNGNYYGNPYYIYPYANAASPSYSSGSALPPDYYGTYGEAAPHYRGNYPSSPAAVRPNLRSAPADASARITVTVPANARVWFDGTETTSTGPLRKFQSPPLTPGQRYAYEIRARWEENGREVTQTRHLNVTAGTDLEVDFPLPSASRRPTPSTRES